MTLSIRGSLKATCALVVLTWVAAANAQEPLQDEAGVGEIVVTAQRRAESIQKTPISITAIAGEDLIRKNKATVDDFLQNVPGVNLSPNANGFAYSIRGISSVSGGGEIDPGITFSVDGIYNPFDSGPLSAFYDVNRIEVLRGPQGTIYGRNAIAGAINVLTNDPNTRDFSVFTQAGVGNYGSNFITGALNAPINEQLAVRVAGDYRLNNGYLSNGSQDQAILSGRAKILYQPNEAIRLLLGVDGLKSWGIGPGSLDLPYADPSNPWQTDTPTGYQNFHQYGVNAQLDIDVGPATLTIIPAYKYNDQARSSFAYGQFANSTITNSQTTIETRLSSNGSGPLNWILGAYYYHNDFTTTFEFPGILKLYEDPISSSSYAGFAQGNYSITDRLRFTAGLRYTHDQKREVGYSDLSGIIVNPFDTDRSWNSWTYKLGSEFDLAENSLLYGSISTGFKAGGTFAASTSLNTSFDPERLTAFEIGSKNRFFHGKLQVNLEVYYYKYREFQVTALEYDPGFNQNTRVTYNADRALMHGGEIEVAYQPNEWNRINFSAAYFKGHYAKYLVPGLEQYDYSGRDIERPQWTASADYSHVFEIADGSRIIPEVQLQYKSGSYLALLPDPDDRSYQDQYVKIDGYIRYELNEGISLSAYVKNITGIAVMGSFASGPVPSVYLEAPRTYGVSLSAKF